MQAKDNYRGRGGGYVLRHQRSVNTNTQWKCTWYMWYYQCIEVHCCIMNMRREWIGWALTQQTITGIRTFEVEMTWLLYLIFVWLFNQSILILYQHAEKHTVATTSRRYYRLKILGAKMTTYIHCTYSLPNIPRCHHYWQQRSGWLQESWLQEPSCRRSTCLVSAPWHLFQIRGWSRWGGSHKGYSCL